MNNDEAIGLAVRYFLLVVFGFALVYGRFFDVMFSPLTYWPAVGALNLFYDNVTTLPGNIVSYADVYARIIPACVAGAAYYLLLILNLTTPMKIARRVWSILFLMVVFLVLNIVRIIVFAGIATGGGNFFDAAHMMMWYFGSTVMVVLIWFLAVALFKIKGIPVYSDMKELYLDAVSSQKKKR
ncbi:MAG: pacearchaeosortase [Nanoarchaeota archaeon]|nr:pacearchaeosortase [Nanoarchaeota archaeon]MBU0976993.1 pacearchaeosortase [Nanoarchaeota archaeon]